MKETWKPVVGFEGLYEVSDLGRVRSLRRGKILAANSARGHYPVVSLSVGGSCTRWPVHRLVLETFRGSPPPRTEAAHGNGKKTDSRLLNLMWKTRVDNHADKRRHGTQCRGESHGRSKLTIARIKQAAELRAKGLSDVVIGKQLGVHSGTIGRALSGQSWAHV